MNTKECRFCKTTLNHELIDLVNAPPSNSFLKPEQLSEPEVYFPLKLYVCDSCLLVQVDEHKAANEIFSADYVYFSSFSKSWLQHCKDYSEKMVSRFQLGTKSRVVEIASNDGYLLQYFKEKGIPTLGIEPTQSTADVAMSKGIETLVRFFGKNCATDLANQNKKADLIAANNVLAHVPDLNDFVAGLKILLSEKGLITVEFPHLFQLVKLNQFDTIYHEHFSYFAFLTVVKVFAAHGLRIFDVEELPTHGGSLRIYADHGSTFAKSEAVEKLIQKETEAGMNKIEFYQNFQAAADDIKHQFIRFLLDAAKDNKKVAAYGAAAKGNTLLNYCGIKNDIIEFVVDASPHKQGRYLPGAHIPVVAEKAIREAKPDYIVIFPWNLKTEITEQLSYIREWGGKFVIAIPRLEIF